MAAEEHVAVARLGQRFLDHGIDVAREDEVGPVGQERHVVLRVVEDRAAIETRIERQTQLLAEQPVAGEQHVERLFGDVEPVGVLELIGTAIEGPHLEAQIVVGFLAHEQVLRELAEVRRAAEEAGDQNDDRVGLHVRIVELKARVAGVVQVEIRAELRQQLLVGDGDVRTAGGVGRCRAARDVDRRDRRTVAERVARSGTSAVVDAVALLAEIDTAVPAIGQRRRSAHDFLCRRRGRRQHQHEDRDQCPSARHDSPFKNASCPIQE